jgi:hypothetical protein
MAPNAAPNITVYSRRPAATPATITKPYKSGMIPKRVKKIVEIAVSTGLLIEVNLQHG